MNKKIAVLAGDGIGPEITKEAINVLKKVADKFGHQFDFRQGLVGGVAIDQTKNPFPGETLKLCLDSDAILFGAIGDPKYDNDPTARIRPEQGLLAMRKELGLYANIRPVFVFKSLLDRSPLKKEIVDGVDFVVVRELISGIYFGERGRSNDNKSAFDTSEYSVDEIARIAKVGFEMAGKRRKKLTVVDKANVLETSRLWRETIQNMEKDYSDIEVEYMFVDNAAQQIIKNPTRFDVIVTENMFGDILTDEASVISGSLGMLPSASLGLKTSLFEPIHGSFPKAAGQNIANPTGIILSAAMLLEEAFEMVEEGAVIRNAVQKVLDDGFGTRDIATKKVMGTKEFGQKIVGAL